MNKNLHGFGAIRCFDNNEKYNPEIIEKKWQNFWAEKRTYKSKVDKTKKNFMCWKCFLILWKNSHGASKKLHYR